MPDALPLRLAAFVAVVAFAAGACGDDDGTVTTFLAPATPSSTVATTAPVARTSSATGLSAPPTSTGGTTSPTEPSASSPPTSAQAPVATTASSVVDAPAGSFPASISENSRYLVDGDGAPWFMVGDAGGRRS